MDMIIILVVALGIIYIAMQAMSESQDKELQMNWLQEQWCTFKAKRTIGRIIAKWRGILVKPYVYRHQMQSTQEFVDMNILVGMQHERRTPMEHLQYIRSLTIQMERVMVMIDRYHETHKGEMKS